MKDKFPEFKRIDKCNLCGKKRNLGWCSLISKDGMSFPLLCRDCLKKALDIISKKYVK